MKEHPELFTADIINAVRHYHIINRNLEEKKDDAYELVSKNDDQKILRDTQPDNLSTLEDRLKRVHIVENASAHKASQFIDQIKSSSNNRLYNFDEPKTDQLFPNDSSKPLLDDKCKDHFISDCNYHDTTNLYKC